MVHPVAIGAGCSLLRVVMPSARGNCLTAAPLHPFMLLACWPGMMTDYALTSVWLLMVFCRRRAGAEEAIPMETPVIHASLLVQASYCSLHFLSHAAVAGARARCAGDGERARGEGQLSRQQHLAKWGVQACTCVSQHRHFER